MIDRVDRVIRLIEFSPTYCEIDYLRQFYENFGSSPNVLATFLRDSSLLLWVGVHFGRFYFAHSSGHPD
jgi:hypothetical protein